MATESFQRQHIPERKIPAALVHKWSAPVLSEGYVPFPKTLLRSLTSLFKGEGAVSELTAVLAIVDYSRPNLTRLPSIEYLAFLSGMEIREFQSALDSLEEKGYIEISGDTGGLNISLDGLLSKVMEVST